MMSRCMRVLGIHRVFLGAIVLISLALGCSGRPAFEPPPEPTEVHCNHCGKVVPRSAAASAISPEGLDLYTCQQCQSKNRRNRS